MIQIKELRKSYKGFQVLSGLNMNINRGDVYGFIGRNGCGKTTTMNIICDIIPKDSGELILGTNGTSEKIRIGYLPESPALFKYMNAYEYLDYIAACTDYSGDIKARTAETIEIVGLTSGAMRRIKGYSRGMIQRLGIAAAIYANPDLLILDEPTSALDPEGRAEVMIIIQRLMKTGTTILLCTHILSDIERVANKVGILSNGVMAVEGSIDEIVRNYSGKTALNIKLNTITPEIVSLLCNSELVTSSNVNSNEIILYTDDNTSSADLYNRISRKLVENNIIPESISINKTDLEQIYLKIVGNDMKEKS